MTINLTQQCKIIRKNIESLKIGLPYQMTDEYKSLVQEEYTRCDRGTFYPLLIRRTGNKSEIQFTNAIGVAWRTLIEPGVDLANNNRIFLLFIMSFDTVAPATLRAFTQKNFSSFFTPLPQEPRDTQMDKGTAIDNLRMIMAAAGVSLELITESVDAFRAPGPPLSKSDREWAMSIANKHLSLK